MLQSLLFQINVPPAFDDVLSPHHHQILSLVVEFSIQFHAVLHVFLAYFDGIYTLHVVCGIVVTNHQLFV